jgi:hypothetical protein
VVHRQDDDLALDAFGSQPRQDIESGEARHGEVGHDHVRAKPLGSVDEQVAVTDGTDDIDVVLCEQSGQAFGDDRVVVSQDGISAHRCLHAAAEIAGKTAVRLMLR